MALAAVAIKNARGRETAMRLRSTCSQIFRYDIATARAERDVAADLRGALIAPQPVHRAAITNADKAGGLLRAIGAFEGHPNTKAALRLLPHVFVRPGELRFAEWGDFDVESREFLAGSAPNAVVNAALEV